MNGPLKEALPYRDVEFPQWAHDVRRYEVIMFGAFPLTYLLSSLVFESINLANGSNQEGLSLYSEKNQDDLEMLLITSASLSVVIATADLIIGKIKKHKNSNRSEIAGEKDE